MMLALDRMDRTDEWGPVEAGVVVVVVVVVVGAAALTVVCVACGHPALFKCTPKRQSCQRVGACSSDAKPRAVL